MIDMHAQYTMVLKSILDIPAGKTAIDKAMSTYPLYESVSKHEYGIPDIVPTREQLNRKILNYYKYREIGFETFGRFLDELQTALEEIMPYYNQLFFSADQDYNIIYNVDYKKTIDTDRAGTSSNTLNGSETGTTITEGESQTNESSTSDTTTSGGSETESNVSNNSKNVETDTPQSRLSVHLDDIDSVDYASKASWNSSEGSDHAESSEHGSANTENESQSKTEGTSTVSENKSNTAETNGSDTMKESILETTKGNFGVVSAQDLISKYRDIIINIEQQIINDNRIAELFMLVY